MNADTHGYKRMGQRRREIESKGFDLSSSILSLSPFIRVHRRSSVANLIFRSLILLGCLTALASLAFAQDSAPAQKNEPLKKRNERPVASGTTPAAEPFDGASVEKMAGQCVRLETESGVIEIEMLAESAPETARNFLNLVAISAFDTTTFSRIVKGFVIQGGNLATRQTMTPALAERSNRTIADEPSDIKHVRGIVSMALPGRPNAATTQFFILVGDAPLLDGKFSAF